MTEGERPSARLAELDRAMESLRRQTGEAIEACREAGHRLLETLARTQREWAGAPPPDELRRSREPRAPVRGGDPAGLRHAGCGFIRRVALRARPGGVRP